MDQGAVSVAACEQRGGFPPAWLAGLSLALVAAFCVVLAVRYRKLWQFVTVGVLLLVVVPIDWELPDSILYVPVFKNIVHSSVWRDRFELAAHALQVIKSRRPWVGCLGTAWEERSELWRG